MKQRYRLMILVLSSCGGVWDEFRRIWELYAHRFPEIKTHFIYAGEDNKEPKPSDLVFRNIKDSYPMNIERTLEAFKYVESKYDYDFLLRTNLSTFWDLERLLKNLDNLPTENCYQGDGPLPPWFSPESRYYLSGTDTIVNRGMIEQIINTDNDTRNLLISDQHEDSAMGRFFYQKLGAPMIKSNIHMMEHLGMVFGNHAHIHREISLAEALNHDHFRIKSATNRESADPVIMNVLYQHYYGDK